MPTDSNKLGSRTLFGNENTGVQLAFDLHCTDTAN